MEGGWKCFIWGDMMFNSNKYLVFLTLQFEHSQINLNKIFVEYRPIMKLIPWIFAFF